MSYPQFLINFAMRHGMTPEEVSSLTTEQLTREPGMYERFSDRARKVMLLANQAAQRLNHEWVGTEHILMGILKMDTSLALDILKHLKIDAAAVEAELNVLITPGKTMVTMGKLPQTPRAKMVIDFAMDFARTWEHTHVGTEHLLIGLAREREGIASQVLIKCGLTVDNAREALAAVISDHPKKEPEMDERTTKTFLLAVPMWHRETSKSAVESARYRYVACSQGQ